MLFLHVNFIFDATITMRDMLWLLKIITINCFRLFYFLSYRLKLFSNVYFFNSCFLPNLYSIFKILWLHKKEKATRTKNICNNHARSSTIFQSLKINRKQLFCKNLNLKQINYMIKCKNYICNVIHFPIMPALHFAAFLIGH